MSKYVLWLFLVFVFSVALFLRVFRLDSVPAGLNRDEAALAYNGYLLSETGKDEWGVSWPISPVSFGDSKLIGYPAVLSLLFNIVPENDFFVRLPSALSGASLPVLLYFLARQFQLSKKSSAVIAFTAAITPVFVFFSRMAFEANVALTLFVGGLLALMSQPQKPKWWQDILGIVLMLLAMLTYNTPLLLLPFVLLIIPFHRGLKNFAAWVAAVVCGAVVWGTITYYLLAAVTQKAGITIFSDETMITQYPAFRNQFAGTMQNILGNQYAYFGIQILKRFIASFSYDFLVVRGGQHPWHALPGWGHVFNVSYVLSLAGFFVAAWQIMKRIIQPNWFIKIAKIFSKPLPSTLNFIVLIYFLIISLVPSIITVDSPHATRSLFFFAMLLMMGGYFLDRLPELMSPYLQAATQRIYKMVLVIIVLSTSVLSVTYFSDYLSKYPLHSAQLFREGLEGAISNARSTYPNQTVAVVDESGYDYILFSWYGKLTPEEYYTSIVRQQPDKIGFRYGEKAGQFHFIAHKDDQSEQEPGLLYWDGTSWILE